MRAPVPQETEADLARYQRSRSMSVTDSTSHEAGDSRAASCASSATLCTEQKGTGYEVASGERLASIESLLNTQQDMLRRILVKTESPLHQTPRSEQVCLPPSDCALGERYEQAMTEAGFENRHEWNAAYIHGVIRIDGWQSRSNTLRHACSPCADTRNVVCMNLMEEDPYYDHLVMNEKVCCGRCEYMKIQDEEHEDLDVAERNQEDLSNDNGYKQRQQRITISVFSDKSDQEKSRMRQHVFFINGEGIDREVITTDIPRYLGSDSLVRPGTHYDSRTSKTFDGFYIKAYRPPTTAMLADLRADSASWRAQKLGSPLQHPWQPLQESVQGGKLHKPHPSPTYPWAIAPTHTWEVQKPIQDCDQSQEVETKPRQARALAHSSQIAEGPTEKHEQAAKDDSSDLGEY